MFKFPKIQNFHNMIKTGLRGESELTFQGKIKLHGSNAGIHIPKNGGEIHVQSRNHIIVPGKGDNAGFAAWVEENKEYWQHVGLDDEDITIYGEWCGKGINSGAAVCTIEDKFFAVFAIMWGTDLERGSKSIMVNDPTMIRSCLEIDYNGQPTVELPSDVYILPYHGKPVTVCFDDHVSLTEAVELINKEVLKVDECDPWIKETFGVSGVGEGIVYHVTGANHGMTLREEYSRLTFKAKGERHSDVKQKKPVLPDPEVLANIKEFVQKFVTENRLAHMAAEHNLEDYLMQDMGAFLKAVCTDVHAESKAEIEASPLEWKQAAKGVVYAARNWYIVKSKEL